MNYRHAYHAGNFADVFKHVALMRLLEHLRRKEKPFCYVDTHAGRGRYDLSGDLARRTREADDGILRLSGMADLPSALAGYVTQIEALQDAGEQRRLRRYPGSPLIARARLRADDRAVLSELNPEEAAALRTLFRDDGRVAVHAMDGYQALKAFLPPTPRRGLVLIDPAFESLNEFQAMAEALKTAHRRWPQGIYALWYPITQRSPVRPFYRALEKSGMRNILRAELRVAEDTAEGMTGCGLVIVNPPWQFDRELTEWLPELARCLAAAPGRGRWRVDWLVPE